jgi:hypothetical protein
MCGQRLVARVPQEELALGGKRLARKRVHKALDAHAAAVAAAAGASCASAGAEAHRGGGVAATPVYSGVHGKARATDDRAIVATSARFSAMDGAPLSRPLRSSAAASTPARTRTRVAHLHARGRAACFRAAAAFQS